MPLPNSCLVIRARLMSGDDIAMGPGKLDLLMAIAETGSIAGAARKMEMSYRRAWLLVDTMNRCFESPLVASSAGGAQGGGAHLTSLGEEVLSLYLDLQKSLEQAAEKHVRKLQQYLAK